MSRFYRICLALRRLPWHCRLFVVSLSFIVLEVPVAYLISIGKDRSVGVVLFFSGVLAALLFRWYKAFAVQCMILSCHIAILLYIKGYSYPSIPTVFAATVVNFFIIWTIGSLRRGWQMSEEAAEKAEELVRLREAFVRNINHEMRSPLMAIGGSIEMLRQDDLSKEEEKMFLDYARYGYKEVEGLVRNILDALRDDVDVSPPVPITFDLGEVITDCVSQVDPQGHSLSIDPSQLRDIRVLADRQQTHQVFRNLYSNALKYSPRETTITIRAWRDHTCAYVSIKDEGFGIPPENIPIIFEKFGRLEQNMHVNGVGLGLYICRRFIENMGGRIWVESTGVEGEGSSFYFTLPLSVDNNAQSVQ
jgi:Osmosensitive K+ channel histidine kinase